MEQNKDEVIIYCREISRDTGEIAVYPIFLEMDEHKIIKLSIRSRFNPELQYFALLIENEEAFCKLAKRKNCNEKILEKIATRI